MFKKIIYAAVLGLGMNTFGNQEPAPQFLYKVLSAEDWKASQDQEVLRLPSADDAFIHFSREDQLDRLIQKYWSNVSEFYVLKIDASKIPGDLVLEANPGGETKYYHLYNGAIPLNAVVETIQR